MKKLKINDTVSMSFKNSIVRKFFKQPFDMVLEYSSGSDEEKIPLIFKCINDLLYKGTNKWISLYESENKQLQLMFITSVHNHNTGIEYLLTNYASKSAEKYLFDTILNTVKSTKSPHYLIVINEFETPDNSTISGFEIYDINQLPVANKSVDVSSKEINAAELYKSIVYAASGSGILPVFPYLLYKGRRIQRLIRYKNA